MTLSPLSVVTHSDFNINNSCNKQHSLLIMSWMLVVKQSIPLASHGPFPLSFLLNEVYYLVQPLTSFYIPSLEWLLTKTAPIDRCTMFSHLALKPKFMYVVWAPAKSFHVQQPRGSLEGILPSCRYKVHGHSTLAWNPHLFKLLDTTLAEGNIKITAESASCVTRKHY